MSALLHNSEYVQGVLSGAFGNKNVPVLGSAPNDIFFGTVKEVENRESTLKLGTDVSVLLYAPTYRESKSPVMNSKVFSHRSQPLEPFSSDFLKKLNSELAERNWILLVKKNHLDTALTIQKDLTHVVEVGQVDDIQEILVHADVLLTDYLSVCFDYLQADRPIIYYIYDLEHYLQETRAFSIYFKERITGPFAKTEMELLELILQSDEWFNAEPYRSDFLRFRREFQRFSDGQATKRLLQYMNLRSTGYPVAKAIEASGTAETLESS